MLMKQVRQQNLTSNVVLFLIFAAVIFIVASYVAIRISHAVEYNWWYEPELSSPEAVKKYGGAHYDTEFSLTLVFCAQKNQLVYQCVKMFTPPIAVLTMAQCRFVIDRIFLYRLYRTNGEQHGIITPKMMCKSVLLTPDGGDDKFNTWFSKAAYTSGAKTYKYDANRNATYEKRDVSDKFHYNDHKCFTFHNVPLDDSVVGLYPTAEDNMGWCGIFLNWLNVSENGDQFSYDKGYWVFSGDDSAEGGKFNPVWLDGDGTNASKKSDHWWTRPDNFLARMGIHWDAPLCIYFLNGTNTADSVKVDSQSLKILLGTNSSVAGGWIGLLQANTHLDDAMLRNLVDSHVAAPYQPTPPCTKPSPMKGFLGFLAAAAPLAFMIPGIGPLVGGIAEGAVTAAMVAGPAIGMAVTATVGGMAAANAGKGTCK
tara:strand:+ start:462 stop:1736 length:1275 start_codon:yes stop_codon:yes gene_type:complete